MSREIKVILISLSIVLALGICFQTGYYFGMDEGNTTTVDDPYLASVEKAWEVIVDDYVENDNIDRELLSQYAIEGMLEYLDDPYSVYLDPESYAMDKDDTAGSYCGIGASLSVIEGALVITAVFDGSPAEKAGLTPGDIILAVDGVTTEGMSLNELVMRVRGEEGTSVTLKIRHPDASEPVDITIVRGEIDAPSVSYEMFGTIAYIIIDQFAQDTDKEFSKALKAVTDLGATGIVLDLRDNPGGQLTALLNITSCFYTDGDILTIRYNDGSTRTYTASAQDIVTDLPVIVLVNENSASASEVLTGALQDNDRALIAGKVTFGKGSVNIMVELPNGGGLYLTTARWLTPDGHLIEGVGITPDIITDLTGDELVQWAVNYFSGNTN
jgi:carboxyl-terminal processing protease